MSDSKNFGPEFDAEPGWGGKLSKWLATKGNTRLLPVLAVAVLVVGIYLFFTKGKVGESEIGNSPTPVLEQSISVIPKESEGFIKVFRRALDQFLVQNQDIASKLKPEQKLFIEQYIYGKNRQIKVVAGQAVDFSVSQIKGAVDAALALSESTLAKWRSYLK